MKFKEMNTPNKLTTIRMFCVPLVLIIFVLYTLANRCGLKTDYVLFRNGNNYLTINQIIIAVLFAFASITDFIDGHMARRLNIVTDYGKIMDPLADKLLVNTTLISLMAFGFFTKERDVSSYLMYIQLVSCILAITTIARDLFVDALRMQTLKKGVVVPAMIWGKLKTATLMPGIVILLFGTTNNIVYLIGLIFVFLGGLFALISGVMYFKAMKQYID